MLCQMVECRQRVGLAASELRDQRHHWRRIVGSPRQSAQHHAHVFTQSTGEAGSRKEFRRVAVVVRTLVRGYLLKSDGKFVGFEGSTFAYFSAGDGNLVTCLLV